MYRKINLVLLATVLLSSLFSCNPSRKIVANSKKGVSDFAIVFYQNGKTIPANDVIQLSKEAFTIETQVFRGKDLFVHAQLGTAPRFSDTQLDEDWNTIAPRVMAESTFNEDRELMLSEAYYCNWFYTADMDWHRFNKVETLPNGGYKGTKEVTRFFLEKTQQPRALKDAGRPLHLFFFTLEGDGVEGTRLREYQCVQVDWR